MEYRSEYTGELSAWRQDEFGRFWGWLEFQKEIGGHVFDFKRYTRLQPIIKPEHFAGHYKIKTRDGVFKARFDQMQSRKI